MIKYSTANVNNKFEVTFDFNPEHVKYSRNNYTATHIGGGTDHRGFREGIELLWAEISIDDGPWQSIQVSSNKKYVITLSNNGQKVKAQALYRLRTLGYHWLDTTGKYPYFWYGNIGNVPHKYNQGYFTDSYASAPNNNLYTIHACVPPDWKHVSTEWSDWAYRNAQNTPNYAKTPGNYEQRNGNYENANNSNGWISDSNRAQLYRKSCLFIFEKGFWSPEIVSSNIATNPSPPSLEVISKKGDEGHIVLYYNSNNSSNGHIKVEAKCKDKIVNVLNYNNSPEFGDRWKKTLYPDFNNLFGESYRGNQVFYRAAAKNLEGYESNWTEWKGVNIYNGRPTIPQNLHVVGNDNKIYDKLTFNWDHSFDPDGDGIAYDIWLKAISNNDILKNDFIGIGLRDNKMTFDISNYPEKTSFYLKISSNDGLIGSGWSEEIVFKKGSKPTKSLNLISQTYMGNLYCNQPRFIFNNWDGENKCCIEFNGIKYDTYKDFDVLAFCGNDTVAFKPNYNIKETNVIKAYMENEYGRGPESILYSFNKVNKNFNINEGDIVKSKNINDLINTIKDFSIVYNENSTLNNVNSGEYITYKIYNDIYNVLNNVNNYLNNLQPNGKFNYTMKSSKVKYGDINDDILWLNLISDLNNI